MMLRKVIFTDRKIDLLTNQNHLQKKKDYINHNFQIGKERTEQEIEQMAVKIYKKRKEIIEWRIKANEKKIKELEEEIKEQKEEIKIQKAFPAQVFKIFLLLRRF